MSEAPSQLVPEKGTRGRGGEVSDTWFAMRLSLIFGVVMLAGKTTAYFITGSSAILADSAESVVHVVAVAFAAFSLRLSARPAAPKFLYGYERIAFFSAGFEGAMIVSAAIAIIVTAAQKWLRGLQLENLGVGTFLLLAAGVLNAGLGWYLLKTGRRAHSLILQANGKHVLTDSWTSFGVVPGLLLVISPVTVSGPGSYIGLEAAAVDSSGSAIVIYSGYDTAGVHTEYGTNYQP